MQLDGRVTVAWGAQGSVGGAVARVSAPEGSRLFLFGPNHTPAGDMAAQIRANGGSVEIGQDDRLGPSRRPLAGRRHVRREGRNRCLV